jgi:hypothetical protein
MLLLLVELRAAASVRLYKEMHRKQASKRGVNELCVLCGL